MYTYNNTTLFCNDMFMERDDFEKVFYVVALSPDSRGIYTYSCLFQV